MGTVFVIEHRSSANYRLGAPGTGHTYDQTYKVWWEPDAEQTGADFPGFSWLTVEAANYGLPKLQSRFYDCDENEKFWVVDSQDWRIDSSKPFTYTVGVTWKANIEWIYSGDDKPWVRVTRNSALRQMPCWRDPFAGGVTQPSFSTVWPPVVDIGGKKIDINGQPSTIAIPQCSITIEWHLHRGFTGLNDGSGEQPVAELPQWLFEFTGTRNDAAFLGFKKGSLLYSGISCSPLDNQTYIVQYRYLWDALLHNEQRPAPNIGNAHFIEPGSATYLGVPFKQATKVAWYQPYGDLIPFDQMFPGLVYDQLGVANPPFPNCANATNSFSRPHRTIVKPTTS